MPGAQHRAIGRPAELLVTDLARNVLHAVTAIGSDGDRTVCVSLANLTHCAGGGRWAQHHRLGTRFRKLLGALPDPQRMEGGLVPRQQPAQQRQRLWPARFLGPASVALSLLAAIAPTSSFASSDEVMVLLSERVISDPVSASNPKVLPGAIIAYEAQVIYNGIVPLTADSLILTNIVPARMSLVVAAAGSGTTSPFDFVDGPLSSNLFCNLQQVPDPSDCIEFSNDGGSSFGYRPQPGTDGTDPAITHFRFRPRGTMAAASVFPSSFTLTYRLKVN